MKITITHGLKEIHGVRVLKDVNMTLESGAVYGFLGKNGSGKTMLMRAVCGLIGLTEGSIEVDGITIGKGQDFPSKLGMLLETPVFLPDRTGYGNLRLLAAIRGEAAPEEIRAALEQTGLDPKDRRKVRKYSLGMRQRLGIACAIMESPGLLVLDEPFNGLDEDGCRLLRGIIGRQREAGCLILLACHDREELETLSDRIYRVEDGVFSQA
nr:ATP-binding cassette domain-containing protein [uncultured Acetatifactor sp.]